MTLKTREEFSTLEEYTDYLSQIQAEKNAQAEAETKLLARERDL